MRTIRLMMSDIDGTILDSHHQLDSRLKAALAKVAQRQIPCCLASARSPLGILPIQEELELQAPLVAYNGALIGKWQEGVFDILHDCPIVIEEATRIVNLIGESFPDVSLGLYAGKDWHVSEKSQWVESEASITGENPQVTDFKAFLSQSVAIHKCLVIGEETRIQQLLSRLQQEDFPQTAFYLSKANYLEMTHKSVSKAHALEVLASIYHVPLADTLAFGDHFNDAPMLEAAGLGVAMGNAPEEVQRIADVVTSTNNQNGVSLYLEQFVLADVE